MTDCQACGNPVEPADPQPCELGGTCRPADWPQPDEGATMYTWNVKARDAEGFTAVYQVQAATLADAENKAEEMADREFVTVVSVRPR